MNLLLRGRAHRGRNPATSVFRTDLRAPSRAEERRALGDGGHSAENHREASGKELEITSFREGDVVGMHEIVLDSPNDTIYLCHDCQVAPGICRGRGAGRGMAGWEKGLLRFQGYLARDLEAELCSAGRVRAPAPTWFVHLVSHLQFPHSPISVIFISCNSVDAVRLWSLRFTGRLHRRDRPAQPGRVAGGIGHRFSGSLRHHRRDAHAFARRVAARHRYHD